MPPDPRRILDSAADMVWRLWKTEPLTLILPLGEGIRRARRNPLWHIPVAAYAALGIYGLVREGTGETGKTPEPKGRDREFK